MISTINHENQYDKFVDRLYKLKKGWDGPGSIPPSQQVLDQVTYISPYIKYRLCAQPTPIGTVEFSHDDVDGLYFDFEITGGDVNFFSVNVDGNARFWTCEFSIDDITKQIDKLMTENQEGVV